MGNETIFFVTVLANFGGILLAYRLWGKTGLFCWVALASVIANIEVVKTVSLFGLVATLGNVIYGTTFLATDILSENHGRQDARTAVGIGFFSLVVFTVLMRLTLLFRPDASDFASPALETIFTLLPRLAVASLLAYLVSQFHDVEAYHFWWRRFPGVRFLWLRNNGSTLVSQALDTLIFVGVGFWGVFPPEELGQIFLSTYLIKALVALCDTPFIYLARRWRDTGKVATEVEGDPSYAPS